MENATHKTVNRAATSTPAAAPRVTIRNAGVLAPRVQAALKVSTPQDPEEKEADATAKKVMRMTLLPAPASPPGRASGAAFRSPYVNRFAGSGIWERKIGRNALQRQSESQTGVPSSAVGIQTGVGSGYPLPTGVRRFMEPRFNADFSAVRVHADDRSARLATQLSARAFTYGNQVFFGRGQYQPESTEGRELLAHELTHTIQQGGAVQRSEDVSVHHVAQPRIQRWGISDVLDYLAEKAYNIPGYRMFTIVLGVNPINMSRADRSGANILRAIVEFLPGGALITQALDKYGVFERAGAWIEQQFRSLAITGSMIRDAIMRFLDSLSWTDIFHPWDVWERAKRIFTDPIDRIISFARGLVAGILRLIREAILRPLAALAEGTPGYELLKAVLGFDPVTGDPVPRNAETLIGGFMRLIGQGEVWENIKRANAIARAFAWFTGALAGLVGFVRQIPSLFLQALMELEIMDIVVLPRAFMKVGKVFGGFLGRFIGWAGAQVLSLLQIIFEVVAPGAMPYIRRAAAAFRMIIQNPVGFVANLVRAGILGFRQFAARFLIHLRTSLINWLTGTLAGAGVYIPQAFTVREIIKFVLSVLGLTWQNVRTKLVKAIGETAVRTLETTFELVMVLVTQGPAAAWERIQEYMTNLREMVMEQIMAFVRNRIVQAAITRLITSLNPAGAFIQAIIAIYNTIMFFVERLRQIMQVAMSFIDSISAIAGGAIAAAANRVEQTMAGLLTLVISFLARVVGLGRVSDAVVSIVNRIREPIDKALDRVVEWIVGQARRLLSAGKAAVGAGVSAVRRLLFPEYGFEAGGARHTLRFDAVGGRQRLMIASDAQPIEEFLARFESSRTLSETQRARVADARTLINTEINPLTAQLQTAESSPERAQEINRQLLQKEVRLSELIRLIVGQGALEVAQLEYNLEGLTGTYGSMPKPRRDDMTADHQPQAAVLVYSSRLPYFLGVPRMQARAGNRANNGYAINLQDFRHRAGRTFGSKGDATKNRFIELVEARTRSMPTDQEKRNAVVDLIKDDMRADVQEMRNVAQNDANYSDIQNLTGAPEEKQALKDRVKSQILSGESRIASQDLDSLKGS